MKSSLVKVTLLRKVNIAEFSCWQESVTNNLKRNVCCQGRIEPQSRTAEATAVEHINLPLVLPSAISNVKVRVIDKNTQLSAVAERGSVSKHQFFL